MDGSTFDTLTRLASNASTRRTAVRSVIGGSVVSAAAAVGLASLTDDASAKKKCKKKCPKCESLTFGAACQTNLQCCTNETNMACLTVNGAGNSDRTCCGSLGFACTELNDCCQNYECSNGTCQPGPVL